MSDPVPGSNSSSKGSGVKRLSRRTSQHHGGGSHQASAATAALTMSPFSTSLKGAAVHNTASSGHRSSSRRDSSYLTSSAGASGGAVGGGVGGSSVNNSSPLSGGSGGGGGGGGGTESRSRSRRNSSGKVLRGGGGGATSGNSTRSLTTTMDEFTRPLDSGEVGSGRSEADSARVSRRQSLSGTAGRRASHRSSRSVSKQGGGSSSPAVHAALQGVSSTGDEPVGLPFSALADRQTDAASQASSSAKAQRKRDKELRKRDREQRKRERDRAGSSAASSPGASRREHGSGRGGAAKRSERGDEPSLHHHSTPSTPANGSPGGQSVSPRSLRLSPVPPLRFPPGFADKQQDGTSDSDSGDDWQAPEPMGFASDRSGGGASPRPLQPPKPKPPTPPKGTPRSARLSLYDLMSPRRSARDLSGGAGDGGPGGMLQRAASSRRSALAGGLVSPRSDRPLSMALSPRRNSVNVTSPRAAARHTIDLTSPRGRAAALASSAGGASGRVSARASAMDRSTSPSSPRRRSVDRGSPRSARDVEAMRQTLISSRQSTSPRAGSAAASGGTPGLRGILKKPTPALYRSLTARRRIHNGPAPRLIRFRDEESQDTDIYDLFYVPYTETYCHRLWRKKKVHIYFCVVGIAFMMTSIAVIVLIVQSNESLKI